MSSESQRQHIEILEGDGTLILADGQHSPVRYILIRMTPWGEPMPPDWSGKLYSRLADDLSGQVVRLVRENGQRFDLYVRKTQDDPDEAEQELTVSTEIP